MTVAPGTPLICREWTQRCAELVWDDRHKLTAGALYICEDVREGKGGKCPYDGCGTVGYVIRGKGPLRFCPNLFQPLGGPDAVIKSEKALVSA
jgi:hypothetical protein